MTRDEVIDVLTVVAAATRRTVGNADVEIWREVIGSCEKAMALKAVAAHLRERPGVWLEPGHVFERVRAEVKSEMEFESDEVRSARQELQAAKVAEDVAELAAGRAIPEQKYKRPSGITPLSVKCPWCKAVERSRCIIPATTEQTSDFHPSRYDAARIAS